jgi:hypothetical protein
MGCTSIIILLIQQVFIKQTVFVQYHKFYLQKIKKFDAFRLEIQQMPQ